ncbi:MAG: exopolysaccharide biosynthesis polyprenyl glycosylphosphotransferase [Rubrobacter sp.]|nr:exopolysaccharide biosynthesis polyprenyl glycosylphosphotransferase [Rubrobacter sp.]
MRAGIKRVLGGVRYRRPLSVLALAALDAASISCSVLAAAYAVGGVERASEARLVLPILLALAIALFAAHGLYDRAPQRRNPGGLVAAVLIWAGLMSVGAVIYPRTEYGLAGILLSTAFVLVFSAGLRLVYEQGIEQIYRRGLGLMPTIVVGEERERARVRRMMRLSSGAYFIAEELDVSVGEDGSHALNLPLLRAALERTGSRHVILAGAERIPDEELLDALRAVRLRGIRMRVAPGAVGIMHGRPVLSSNMGLPLVEVVYPELDNTQRALKRILDVAVSLAALVLLSPLLLAVAAAIKAESPGYVFFRQKRVGADEEVFLCYKFRSMYADAEARQAELEASNEAGGVLFKMRDDPRVTRVGEFIRRWSIDELPQLINVFMGEMSLVGPRPLPLRDYERMVDPNKQRLAAVPGLTGYWQISGRSDLSFEDMTRLDLYYIENWSLSLDIKIILKTIAAVLNHRGAY